MSERYLKLFSLEENLYIPGSPVLIAAGALLKDTQTGRILGQLKLQSISDQSIKAATVALVPLDTVGNPLGEPVSYQYLDLKVTRDAYWGNQDPILRSFHTRLYRFCERSDLLGQQHLDCTEQRLESTPSQNDAGNTTG